MKRGFLRHTGRAVATLCFFVFAANAIAADLEPMRLVHIDNEAWQSRGVIFATSADTVVRTSDCTSFSIFTRNLPYAGSALIDSVAGNLCSNDNPGVAILPVKQGSVRAWSELTYRDALGNFNAVEIPSLPQSLGQSAFLPGGGFNSQSYHFAGIENGYDGKSTFFAILTEGGKLARVAIEFRDEMNRPLSTEQIDVDGFLFYEVETRIRIGNAVMTNQPLQFGPSMPANVYAVAFVGRREGGSPRVEVPALSFAVAVP